MAFMELQFKVQFLYLLEILLTLSIINLILLCKLHSSQKDCFHFLIELSTKIALKLDFLVLKVISTCIPIYIVSMNVELTEKIFSFRNNFIERL